MIEQWELTYRFRRDYERGGPWVYVLAFPVSNVESEDAMRALLLQTMYTGEGGVEIINLRHMRSAPLVLGSARTISAHEARGNI